MASETKPFLTEYESQSQEGIASPRKPLFEQIFHPILLHLVLVAVYTTLFAWAAHTWKSHPTTSLHRISRLKYYPPNSSY